MSLLLLAALLIVAALAACRLRRAAVPFIILVIVYVELMGSGVLPALLPAPLLRARLALPQWKARNVIVLLGGGVTRWPEGGGAASSTLAAARVMEATRLYHACRRTRAECMVMPSGGNEAVFGRAEAAVMRGELEALGVEPAHILPEPASANTFQNAQFCAALLAERPGAAVFLVSSGLHLRRALLYFSHFGLQATPAPADWVEPKLSLIPRSYNFLLFDLALHETLGVWRYRVYEAFGWNPVQPGRPGVL